MTDIPNIQLDTSGNTILPAPDCEIDVREMFGIDIDMKVPAFSQPDERTPDVDDAYVFDPDTTLAILAGFAFNPISLWYCEHADAVRRSLGLDDFTELDALFNYAYWRETEEAEAAT